MFEHSTLPDEPKIDFDEVKKTVSEAFGLPAGEWENYGASGGSYLLMLNDKVQFRIQHIWDDEVDEETGEVLSKTYHTSFITTSEYPRYVSINTNKNTNWPEFSRKVVEAYRELYEV